MNNTKTIFNTDETFVYQIVVDGKETKYYKGVHDLFENCGFRLTGVNQSQSTREELQRQPKFSGLIGPMWNGYHELEGVKYPCIRYECPKEYATYAN